MTAPQTSPASPDRPKGATPFGILVGVVTMALWGAAMFAFGGWLLGIYGPALDWGANPTLGIPLGIIPAMVAMHGCRKAHLGEGLTAFLVASVVAAVLAANIVAVAVILWAVSPEMAMGVDGYLAAYVGGVLLSLPVAYGASALLQGWQTTDLQWNEWFPNRHSRYATWVGLVLGGGAFLIYESAHPLLVGWLFTTYPAASGFFLSGARFAVFLAAVSFFFTGLLGLALRTAGRPGHLRDRGRRRDHGGGHGRYPGLRQPAAVHGYYFADDGRVQRRRAARRPQVG